MFKTITISILSAIIALGSAWEALAAPKQLKFAIFTPVKEPTYKAMFVPFAEGATRDSKGTIKIDNQIAVKAIISSNLVDRVEV